MKQGPVPGWPGTVPVGVPGTELAGVPGRTAAPGDFATVLTLDQRQVPVRVLAVDVDGFVVQRLTDLMVLDVPAKSIAQIVPTRTEELPRSFVRNYQSKSAKDASGYLDGERPLLKRAGYEVANTQWLPGSRSTAAIVFALLLFLLVIGILILIIILMAPPPGVLRVTYERVELQETAPAHRRGAEERMTEIRRLQEQGLITDSEAETKRQAVLADL